jgi:hypothetical protein
MDLIRNGPGDYDLSTNGVVTHKIASIRVPAAAGTQYRNGARPTHVTKWVFRAVNGTYEKCQKFASLDDLLSVAFPARVIKLTRMTT